MNPEIYVKELRATAFSAQPRPRASVETQHYFEKPLSDFPSPRCLLTYFSSNPNEGLFMIHRHMVQRPHFLKVLLLHSSDNEDGIRT